MTEETKRRRRDAGRGSVITYNDSRGRERFAIKYRANGKQVMKRGYLTKRAATQEVTDQLAKVAKGEWAQPSKMPLGEYLDQWLAGMRIAPSTRASYDKNIRLHVRPKIGDVPMSKITPGLLDVMYRELETAGRADGKPGGLSARTTRYVHTIIGRALRDAVRQGLLVSNPCERATPPSAKEAKAPEMQAWTRDELATFLRWASKRNDQDYPLWLFYGMTGCRRGEALAIKWDDVDFERGRVAIRRSAGVVKVHGEGEQVLVGPTKTGQSRVVDLDPVTLTALKAHRSARAEISLHFTRRDALVFGDLAGEVRHPERLSRTFRARLAQIKDELGEKAPRPIRLHDLRHTHATLLLGQGTPVKIVSERLGHASAMITLGIYAHSVPGHQALAAGELAASILGG